MEAEFKLCLLTAASHLRLTTLLTAYSSLVSAGYETEKLPPDLLKRTRTSLEALGFRQLHRYMYWSPTPNLHKETEFSEIRCVLNVFLSPSCDSEASSQSPVPGFVFLLEEKISVASWRPICIWLRWLGFGVSHEQEIENWWDSFFF
ncbi:hypothetical protein Bca52824_001027 [Brassica carinata]|uniref:Uncharacterized protein n=1 Tax=Brassica carinata TaxID=52824 RepID=A0A8X8BDF2_BRACI|nr:hypothetical protein Bca52824_001027 [Brassica carinata]